MTTSSPARTIASCIDVNRTRIGTVVLGTLAGGLALAAVVAWQSGGSSAGSAVEDVAPSAASQPLYPHSRENVRGHVFETGEAAPAASQLAERGQGLETAASSASQPMHPASRENVRGHVFETGESAAAASQIAERGQGLVPAGSSASGPAYPASREGVRGHVE